METILLGFILFAAIAALLAWWFGRRMRVESGVPIQARVVYSDTGAWKKIEKPLFSRRYLLTGKPDYLVDMDGMRIPIEVKPSRVAPEPRVSDTMQLAAYGLLVEETFGTRPSYGLLKYRNAIFRVEFTDALRGELIEILNVMRSELTAQEVARSHTEAWRCRGCGYRAECGQALEEMDNEQ